MNTAFVKTALFSTGLMLAGSAFALTPEFSWCSPASGSEVSKLEKIDTYWDNVGDGLAYNWNVEVYLRNTANGEKVASAMMDYDWDDLSHYPVTFFAPFSTPGSYELVIPAGALMDMSENPVSPEVVLSYIISGEDEPGNYPVTFKSVTPAEGSTLTSLSGFKTYWNVGDYLLAGEKDAQLIDAKGNVVATSFIEFDWSDETLFTFGFGGSFASGDYTVKIPAGALGMDGKGLSEPVTLKYSYEGVATPLNYTEIYPAPGSTIRYNDGTDLSTINVRFADNIALANAGTKVIMTDDKGKTYESDDIIAMNLMGEHSLIIRFDENPIIYSGDYTLVIPAGTVVSGASKNEEITVTWTYVQDKNLPTHEVLPDFTPLTFTTFNVTDAEGNVVVDFMQPDLKLEKFPAGTVNIGFEREDCLEVLFQVNDAETQENYLTVWTHEDPEGIYNIGLRDEDGVFHFALNNRDIEFLADRKYEVYVHAFYRFDGVPEDQRIEKGEGRLIFEGASEGYPYSDAQILSVTPMPGTELDLVNRTITITYSEPVEIFEGKVDLAGGTMGKIELTGLNNGMGGVTPFELIESNKSKTRWSFTISQSYLKSCTDEVNPIVAANDMQGRRVRPADEDALKAKFGITNNGQKTNTTQSMIYFAYYANPEVVVTPDEGPVESLYAFDFTAPTADHKSINFNGGIDAEGNIIVATLRDANGVIVGTLDTENYDVEYNVPDPNAPGVSDVAIIRMTMHLDKPVTEPGLYILDIPSTYFMTGTQFSSYPSQHISLEFTIGDQPLELNAVSLKEGGNYSELGTVTAYAGTEVVLAPNAQMEVYRSGSRRTLIASAPLQVAKSGKSYRVYADFCDAANGYAPFELDPRTEEGQDYDVVIPENSVLTASGKSFAEKVVTIHTPAEGELGAVETASLTMEFPYHTASVSNVVKGQPVNVMLQPAAGWKVQAALLNGEDVANQIVDSMLAIPSIEEAANLQVLFAFDGEVQVIEDYTGVTEVNGTEYRVRMDGSLVVIEGLSEGDFIQVCNLGGAIITSAEAAGDSIALSLEKGVYIVTINGAHAVKLSL
ncbi:MAG: hypothetical protein K2O24_07710 [Muribaculaceae bacterium]|nr:hypothetical protein [Muribaculaceae bacterium]